VLKSLNVKKHPDLIVGFEHSDDAGVFRLNPDTALIQTIDFFTPVLDSPFEFGRIAASNALSDVYAMGGRPITAMNIVCFPVDELPESVLHEILAGGLEKIDEADAVLVGGHSIDDKELKYGLSVTGLVHPKKVLTNCNAQVGDRLILTKPIGTGIIATAIKGKLADKKAIQAMIAVSATLNKKAAETMLRFSPNACTDVTGFGLAGHLLEIAKGSRKSVLLDTSAVPVIPQAEKYARMGLIPAGTYKTKTFCDKNMSIDSSVNPVLADILFDPQTSGGLLISISDKNTERCINAMRQEGVDASVIGEVTGDHKNGFITVI